MISLLAAIVLAPMVFMWMGENPKSYFSDYQALEESGLIERGWIPAYLPRSAYEINETHNIDTNIVQIRFKFKQNDISLPVQYCGQGTFDENDLIFKCKDGILRLTQDGAGYFTNEANEA